MKWKKLGKIFDPSEHYLIDGFNQYAKSPQALVYDDFIRIYFSAQKRTIDGKFVSCPQYVDLDKELRSVLGINRRAIIDLGGLGEFDEHGIFPFNVLKHNDNILAYTSGWSRRSSVSIDMSIGFATSKSGESFSKYGSGGPIMSATHNEPNLVGDPFVKYFNNKFHMWYIFGDEWNKSKLNQEPERSYKIAYAHSTDGINWIRNGKYIIQDSIENEAQALPTVLARNGMFHMYFCYRNIYDFRNNKDNTYRLGYAYSLDGIEWVRDDSKAGITLSTTGWDSEMMCYPHIFECEDNVYLLYNGNEFGKHGFGVAKLIDSNK